MAVYLIESKADQQKLIDHVGEDTAKLFFTLKNRLKSPENDIYYWLKKDPEELEDRLNDIQNTKTRSQKDAEASEGAELIYNQNGWKVYYITTYEASAKYGKNTKWCIAGSKVWSNGERGEEYFNNYTSKGVEFYFYINSSDGDEKYALALTPQNGNYQVFNAEDDDVSDEDLYFLPNVEGLPRFTYDDLVSEDGTFIYTGEKPPMKLRDRIFKVKVDKSVTKIQGWAFSGCKHLKTVEIENGVFIIGSGAFEECQKLSSVLIPDSVTQIDSYTFAGCESLNSVILPKGLKLLGSNAFNFCTSLESIDIPGSVEEIMTRTFESCQSLSSLTINEGVRKISKDAFAGCISLEHVVIPKSVVDIGYNVFAGTATSLAVEYAGSYEDWQKVSIKDNPELIITSQETGEVLYEGDPEYEFDEIDQFIDELNAAHEDEEERDAFFRNNV